MMQILHGHLKRIGK